MQFTKKRKLVYDILKDIAKPASVEQIYAKLLEFDINISTIYRALDFLTQNKLVEHIMLDKTAYFFAKKDKHTHYMICEKCQNMLEIDCKVLNLIKDAIEMQNFTPKNHELTVYGYCSECNLIVNK